MPKSIISEGKTTQEAIEKGLKELKVSKSQVEIKVLEEKKKSFFNILDPHVVKVELTVIENNVDKKYNNKEIKEEVVDKEALEKAKLNIEKFLNELLPKISENIEYSIKIEENLINVVIFGDESSVLIGYRGEALNSLQTIISNVAVKNLNEKVKVILDVGNYKDARKKTLEELALKIEKTVVRTGKQVTLEPMTAYERKIIHTKLQESKNVETHSIGEGERRRVVITKK